VKRRREPIIGRAVADQTRLRPTKPVRTLDEFLVFLRRVHALTPKDARPRPPTTGRFLL